MSCRRARNINNLLGNLVPGVLTGPGRVAGAQRVGLGRVMKETQESKHRYRRKKGIRVKGTVSPKAQRWTSSGWGV